MRIQDYPSPLSPHQQVEVDAAQQHNFELVPDPKRGSNWFSFRRGPVHIWQARKWRRAYLLDNHYTGHQSFDTFKLAMSFKPVMQTFVKKPVAIQAIRYMGYPEEIHHAIPESIGWDIGGETPPSLGIPTLEGTMRCNPGSWIIRGISGEYYPCQHDIFEKTYEIKAIATV